MRVVVWSCLAVVLLSAGSAFGQVDREKLVEAYKAFDLERNGGKGASEETDSGKLGWVEGRVIEDYARLWEVTGDVYWLGRLGIIFGGSWRGRRIRMGTGF